MNKIKKFYANRDKAMKDLNNSLNIFDIEE